MTEQNRDATEFEELFAKSLERIEPEDEADADEQTDGKENPFDGLGQYSDPEEGTRSANGKKKRKPK